MSQNQVHHFTKTADLNSIKHIADAAAKIIDKNPFVLWLLGQMGAGKTSFTRYFLQALGLHSSIPVCSPTFSYLNDYIINDAWYAHMDLYRVDPSFSPEDLGLIDQRNYHGLVIEWPDKIPLSNGIYPTHILAIDYSALTLNERTYSFYSNEQT